jgi:hypothetical protein
LHRDSCGMERLGVTLRTSRGGTDRPLAADLANHGSPQKQRPDFSRSRLD